MVDFSPNRHHLFVAGGKCVVFVIFLLRGRQPAFWICDRTGGIQTVYLFYNKHFLRNAKNNHRHYLVKCSVAFFWFLVIKVNKIHSVMFCILFIRFMSATVLIYVLVVSLWPGLIN